MLRTYTKASQKERNNDFYDIDAGLVEGPALDGVFRLSFGEPEGTRRCYQHH